MQRAAVRFRVFEGRDSRQRVHGPRTFKFAVGRDCPAPFDRGGLISLIQLYLRPPSPSRGRATPKRPVFLRASASSFILLHLAFLTDVFGPSYALYRPENFALVDSAGSAVQYRPPPSPRVRQNLLISFPFTGASSFCSYQGRRYFCLNSRAWNDYY